MEAQKETVLVPSKKSADEIYQELRKPLPPEAMKKYQPKGPSGYALTDISAGWVIRKMNEVVGRASWRYDFGEHFELSWEGKYGPQSEMCIWVTVTVAAKDGTFSTTAPGGSGNNNGADGMKSAITSGMTKALSYWGVGEDVFCGLVDPDQAEALAREKADIRRIESRKEWRKLRDEHMRIAEEAGINPTPAPKNQPRRKSEPREQGYRRQPSRAKESMTEKQRKEANQTGGDFLSPEETKDVPF